MERAVVIQLFRRLQLTVFYFSLLLMLESCSTNNPVTVQSADKVAHASRITQDETWSASQIHIITNNLIVDNATLTIEAGTKIQMKDSTLIIVAAGGALKAIGTARDSILFTVEENSLGAWQSIYFDPHCNLDLCQLEYCIFENGGAGDSLSAMLICEKVAPPIQYSTFRHSRTNGLRLIGQAEFNNFSHNKFRNNQFAPILLPMSAISSLQRSCSFTGNGKDVIRVVEPSQLVKDVIWRALDVPYQIETELRIEAHQITLQPGVKLQFTSTAGFEIAYSGVLLAEGSPDSMIYFNGASAGQGFWRGIFLLDNVRNANSQFKHCIFDGGGSQSIMTTTGNLVKTLCYCRAASAGFSNCIFQNSGGYAIIFDKVEELNEFKNNRLTLNAGPPIQLTPEVIGSLKNNQFYNNDENYIEVMGGNLIRGSNIPNFQIPYRLMGRLDIYYIKVTIEPGTVFELYPNASISVSAGAALIADGLSPAGAITFTGAFPNPGSWNYIYFSQDCNAALCELNYCKIEYGGGDISWPANIYLEGASPKITNCTIAYSKHWGIFRSNNAQPDLTNTVFSGNLDGDIWP